MSEDVEAKTPTSALIAVMETFGESEPTNVIVIWEDEEHVNIVKHNVTHSQAFGLLHLCAERVKRKFLGIEEGEEE